MGKFNYEDMKTRKTGSNIFFNLKEGEEAKVRFLYNSLSDIEGYDVHLFTGENNRTTIVMCSREEGDPKDACKWCSEGMAKVGRIVLPIFNEDEGEIQYWTRSEKWMKDVCIPIIVETQNQGKSIASQVYKIKRTGKGLNTSYALINIGGPDDKKAADFGDLKSPFELNIIREPGFDPTITDSNSNPTNNDIRRTTEVF